jgi:hypothetical protein
MKTLKSKDGNALPITRTFDNLGKKLLVGTIITATAFVVAEVRVTATEKIVTIGNQKGVLRVEQLNDNEVCISFGGRLLSDVDLTPDIDKYFGGKISIKEILIGNPSPLLRVVDADGMYGWILIVGDNILPLTSKFLASKTVAKEDYDEKRGEYALEFYDANGKLISFCKVDKKGRVVVAATDQK